MREAKSHLLYKQPEFSPFIDGQTGEGPAVERPQILLSESGNQSRQKIFAVMSRAWKDMTPDPDGKPTGDSGKDVDPTKADKAFLTRSRK